MKKYKVIIPMLMVFVLLAVGFSCDVYASETGQVENGSFSNNLFEGTSSLGIETDHTSCTYSVGGEQAWCIEAGVSVVKGEYDELSDPTTYNGGKLSETVLRQLSYAIYQCTNYGGSYDYQIVQAVVWTLSGNTVKATSLATDDILNQYNTLLAAAQSYNFDADRPANAAVSVDDNNYDLTYDKSMNAYVSSRFTVSDGSVDSQIQNAPDGSYIQEYNGGYRLIVPATSVTSDVTITVSVTGTSTSEIYGMARVYVKSGSQTLIKPRMETVTSEPTSVSFNLTAVGNLKVIKTDEHGNRISGAQYLVTGPSYPDGQVFPTNESGEIEIDSIKAGTYTVKEIYVPNPLVLDTEVKTVTVRSGYTEKVTFTNEYKRGSARIQKVDYDYGTEPTGDCKLQGAVYGLYADEDIYEGETLVFSAVAYEDATKDNAIITVTTGKDGWSEVAKEVYSTILGEKLDGIPLGNYYWKELEAPEGYLRADEDDIDDNDKIDFKITDSISATEHDEPVVNKETENQSIRGRVDVVKYLDNLKGSEKETAEGVVLKLTLKSDENQCYYVTTDKNGYGEFVDEDYLEKHYGLTLDEFDDQCTIPYGTYTLSEYRMSEEDEGYYFYIINETIVVEDDQMNTGLYIVADYIEEFYLKIIKTDKDTGNVVELSGTKYKIWDCQEGEFVSQKVYPTENYYDEFSTNEDGELVTPEKLKAGDYIIYEIEAPYGYYLDDEYRLPDDESDYGDVSKGGVKISVTDYDLTGTATGTIYELDTDYYYDIEISNTPQKATISIYKEGEILVGVNGTTVSSSDSGYTDEGGEPITAEVGDTLYTFNYDYEGLEGVKYEIELLEYNGYHDAGWTTTMITGANGCVTSEELYLGNYVVREIEVPEGYVLSKQEYYVTLEYKGQNVKLYDVELEAQDDYQKLGLKFEKEFEDPTYKVRNYDEAIALFGVYTNEDININGFFVSKGSLVDLIWTDEKNEVISNFYLPAGSYCVRELYVTYPYAVSGEEKIYELDYSDDPTEEFVVIEGEDWLNTIPSAPLMILKLSTSSTDSENYLSLVGDTLTDEAKENLDELSEEYIYSVVGDMNIEETIDYLVELLGEDSVLTDADKKKIITVENVTYQVFMDEDCTIPLYKKNEETGEYTELVTVTTDLTGAAVIYDIPYGTYYVKEISAPEIYQIADDVVTINVNETTSIPKVFQITYDDSVIHTITKTDIFTSDVVPNCTFEITDEDENVLVHATTDDDGLASFPVDIFEDGKTYWYTEIDAPEIYNIDTTPHAFVAEFDENGAWVTEKIEVTNKRNTIDKVVIKKTDSETGEGLAGCVFSIVLLDDDGNEYVNADGETIYLVENAVTDENGEYTIVNPFYGTYKFIEMVAPEGYELDEDLTGLTFTIDGSVDTIIFEVTNTGDIAVIATLCIALVSVIGIAFVISRRKSVKNSI